MYRKQNQLIDAQESHGVHSTVPRTTQPRNTRPRTRRLSIYYLPIAAERENVAIVWNNNLSWSHKI